MMLTAITRYYQNRRDRRQALETAARYLGQVEDVLRAVEASGPEQAVQTARRLVALTHRFPEAEQMYLPQLRPLGKALRQMAPAAIDASAVYETLLTTARRWPAARPQLEQALARQYRQGGWVVAFPPQAQVRLAA